MSLRLRDGEIAQAMDVAMEQLPKRFQEDLFCSFRLQNAIFDEARRRLLRAGGELLVQRPYDRLHRPRPEPALPFVDGASNDALGRWHRGAAPGQNLLLPLTDFIDSNHVKRRARLHVSRKASVHDQNGVHTALSSELIEVFFSKNRFRRRGGGNDEIAFEHCG